MKKIFSIVFAVLATAFTFTSCEDVPMPYDQPGTQPGGGTPATVIAPAGTGTEADPFNVAAVNAEANKLAKGETSATGYYFKGKVVSFKSGEEPGNSYGNSTFYISDDGTSNKQFYVYRCYAGPNNKKFTSADELKIGDEVTVYGKLTNYNGTLETAQNSAYVVAVNSSATPSEPSNPSEPTEGTGDGTQASPYNVAAITSLTQALAADQQSDKEYYFKGIVSQTKDISAQYKNATFYISDDGTQNNEFYVFRAKGLGGADITSANDVKVGDVVVICGKVVNYKGNTPETVQGSCYIYSINGKTEAATPSDPTPSDPSDPTVGGAGVSISGTTVTLTNDAVTAGTSTVTLDLATLGLANQTDPGTVTFPDGTTLTFDANGEQNGPKYYDGTKGVRVYKNNTMTFEAKSPIANIVFECDAYNGTNYVGNATATVAFNGNKAVYNNVYTEATGGGVQLRVKTITITYAK